MAQFDVYRNPNPATCDEVPYLLDLQADLHDALATRVVAPLIAKGFITPVKYLHPIFNIEDQQVVMSTAKLAGVPVRSLGKKVESLQHRRGEIIGALDFLFTGFE